MFTSATLQNDSSALLVQRKEKEIFSRKPLLWVFERNLEMNNRRELLTVRRLSCVELRAAFKWWPFTTRSPLCRLPQISLLSVPRKGRQMGLWQTRN